MRLLRKSEASPSSSSPTRSTTPVRSPRPPRCGTSASASRTRSPRCTVAASPTCSTTVMKVLPQVSAVAKDEIGGPRRVAILGRPNVGKSSLLNKAAGEERVVVNELAGTTRDPVDEQVELGGKIWRFVDTAGIRRRVHLQQGADFYASLRTQAALEKAEVAVVRARRHASRSASRTCASSTSCSSRAARSCSPTTSGTSLDDEPPPLPGARDRAGPRPRGVGAAREHLGAHRPPPREARARARDRARVVGHAHPDRQVQRVPRRARRRSTRTRCAAASSRASCSARRPRRRPPTFVLFTTGFLDPGYRRFIQRRLREIYGFEGSPDRHQHAGARASPALGRP